MTKEQEKAVKVFCKNPFWKEYYETAPSDECKEYIGLQFGYSMNPKSDEYNSRSDELEDMFTIDDWRHLAKYAGNNPFRGRCIMKVRELKAKQEAEDGAV